jgi:peptide methionine sulfoxide reductase MsrA
MLAPSVSSRNFKGLDDGSNDLQSTLDRSVIFYHSEEQKEIAERVTGAVQNAHYQGQKIVTLIVPAVQFWDAEEYHQLYLEKNPGKLKRLQCRKDK